jgi:hypothetical protein
VIGRKPDDPKTLFVAYDDEKKYSVNAVGFPSSDLALVVVYSKQGNVTFLNVGGHDKTSMGRMLRETSAEYDRKFKA